MRRVISVLICLFLFAVLVSCGAPEAESTETSADSLPETVVTTAVTTTAITTTTAPATTTAAEEIPYREAIRCLEEGKLEEAYKLFLTIEDYRDVDDYLDRFAFRYTAKTERTPHYANTTYYEYDEYGKTLLELYFASSGSMHSSTYQYDDNENLIEYVYSDGDGSDSRVTYEYDENNHPLRKHEWYGVIEIECDENGNAIKFTKDDGEEIERTYDASGRLLVEVIKYSEGDLVTTIEYDSMGRPIKRTSDADYSDGPTVTTWQYDERGNLLKEDRVQSNGISRTYTYEYDAMGNCTKYASYYSLWDSFVIYTFQYDENGNMTEERREDEKGLDYTEAYEYDESGNCIKETHTDHKGGSTTVRLYEYDAYGNLLKETASGETNSPEDYTITTYTDYKLYYNPIEVREWPQDFIAG